MLLEKKKEEADKNQKIFDDEYLEYIIKNQENFIELPPSFQYRDANVRYYDPEKKIVFKRCLRKIWSIDERMSKINFDHLIKSNVKSNDKSSDESGDKSINE